ncbi:hypothetical protein CDD83_4932 [Cordyceps sp. RAO-2017]|nr:hypothetical protein CDD83_4932 [Cordyceps sp. RAO-2017]
MSGMSFDAGGLIALAGLSTIQQRTALTGTATFLDALVLCPGIHTQQRSTGLNGGEHPACAALTTGYVFRVENPAVVFFLQQVGVTGHLTTLQVIKLDGGHAGASRLFSLTSNAPLLPCLAYGAAVLWGVSAIVLLTFSRDWGGLCVVLLFMAARLCNIVVVRRRVVTHWSGASEPGAKGDLLVLLSQDRWVRIRGAVDHLKAVTSGRWLRDESTFESWLTALATLVVYAAAALVSKATEYGKLVILALLCGSAGLLALANAGTPGLTMHGHHIKVVGASRKYARRLLLAEELIEESGRDDWAVRMGMIGSNMKRSTAGQAQQGPVIM